MRDYVEGLFIVALVVAMIFIPAYAFDRYQCSSFSDLTGLPTKYAAFQCWAKKDGEWVPKEFIYGDAIDLRTKQEEKHD